MLQSMGAGINASLNRRYRTMQYNLALDVMDLQENIYNIDQLTAMRYVKAVWASSPSDMIEKCWQKCGLLGHSSSERTPVSMSVSLDEEELTKVTSNLAGVQTKVSVNSRRGADDDDNLERMSSSSVSELVLQDWNERLEVSSNSEELGTAEAQMSYTEQLTAIQTCFRLVECQETISVLRVYHPCTPLLSSKHKSVKKRDRHISSHYSVNEIHQFLCSVKLLSFFLLEILGIRN